MAISSTNTVSATTPACTMVAAATAKHKISPRSLTISPATSVTGGRVTIAGVSYTGYTPITVMTFGGISVLPVPAPFVDAGGSFSVDVAVPVLTVGLQTVNITAGSVQSTVNLVVVSALPSATATSAPTPTATATPAATATPTPTPTPTLVPLPPATDTPAPPPSPTPTPAPGTAALLAPLGDNLLVVWSYNGNGQSWQYFSPNPGLTSDNQLATLVTDKLYWIKVKQDQPVLLNGRQRNITAGWSLIHW